MKPKKSLGQNFLRDQEVLKKIIEVAKIKSDDNILEIGPGEGALSEKLMENAGKIIAIEKDDNLAKMLDSKWKRSDKIKVINSDILEVNLTELIEKNNFQNYKVIANIPYYITSPIIKMFLEAKYIPSEMILMVQKEVAKRICALPGEMSILSISVQYCAKPEILFYVSKKSFWPIPKVDSAVIRIIPHNLTPSPSPSKGEEGNAFFQVVKAGFSSKRKTLLNNLSNSFHISKEETEEKIKKAGLDPTQRAQELSVEDWEKLLEMFNESR